MTSSNGFGDCIFVDDEHKLVEDQPVPMALEKTEPMRNESDEMVLLYYNVFVGVCF